MIALIDDGDAHRGGFKFLRGGESAEPSADDDDMMEAWHSAASLTHANICDPFILAP